MKEQVIALFLAAAFALTGCNNADNKTSDTKADTSNGAQAGASTNTSTSINPEDDLALDGSCPQLAPLEKGETIATISTNYGDIKVRFLPQYAPKAVENFVTHAKNGYYDGVTFHRVIEDFMIQGGDPEGTGMGGESIWGEPFGVEASPEARHINGALCMARAMDPVSIGSQFYIVQNDELDDELFEYMKQVNMPVEAEELYKKHGGCPFLDNEYTVFGQVYEGMSVVNKIADSETDANDKPVSDVIINKITVEQY